MQNQKHNNPTVTSQNIAAWNASRDKDGKTGLMQIAASGNLELATALIKGGANLLAKDNTGNTVIQWAEKSKSPAMVKLIEDSLIEKYGVTPRDPEDQFTASSYVNYKQGELAIISNFYGTVNLQATHLKKKALQKLYVELNQKDKGENAPWNYMLTALRIQNTKSNKNNAETLKDMMEKEIYGLQASIAKTENEKPALTKSRGLMLMLAAMNGHDAVVTYLLKNGADPHHKLNGITPLMLAVKYGTPDIIEAIINKIKEPNNYLALKNQDGYSALMLAVMANRAEVAKMLIDQGASVDAVDDHKTTPLMYAARGGNQDILQQIMRALPSKHTGIQAKNTQGDTALHCAAQQPKNVSSQTVTVLIEAGADINATNQAGHTPLKIAYQKGNKQNILNILKHGQSLHFNGSPLVYWHIIAWKKLAHALFSQPQAQIPVERSHHTPAVELTQDPLSNATHDLASDANLENGPSTPQEDTHSTREIPSINANKKK